jgi:putative FmdB family regulatory protein
MPIYEYACEKCGNEFEAEQRITEDPLKTHDGCGGPVKRLISRTAFSLKGGGWYSDHYGLKSGGNGSSASGSNGKSDSSSKTGAAPKPEAKTEAKPEKKSAKSKPSSGGGKAA